MIKELVEFLETVLKTFFKVLRDLLDHSQGLI